MTEPDTHLPTDLEADLAALADGNVAPARRAELEALVAREPAVAAALERQRAALALLSRLDTPAPLALRLRVEELEARPPRLHRRRWIPAAFLATASATVALVLVLVLMVGGGPAVEDVFALGARPATAPAGAAEQIDGLAFPRPHGWRAAGVRRDVVDGRETRTVFYEKAGQRVAYTIVARPALAERDRALAAGGRRAYSWPRAGHTCVISGAVDEAVLREAARWR